MSEDSARPFAGIDERLPQLTTKGRQRKRGPRSMHAIIQRSSKVSSGSGGQHPPSDDPGKSGSESLVFDSNITVLFLNIRGYLCHRAELETYIKTISKPSIVGITESFLDASI